MQKLVDCKKHTMRILIVEDEEKLANHLKNGFEMDKFIVDMFIDAFEAENHIEIFSSSIDVIILDVMLPGKSGLEICQNLRNKNISIPVLMLTARSEMEEKLSGFNAGADD